MIEFLQSHDLKDRYVTVWLKTTEQSVKLVGNVYNWDDIGIVLIDHDKRYLIPWTSIESIEM